MSGPSRFWTAGVAVLIVAVMVLASAVVLFTVPTRSVIRIGVNEFVTTFPSNWGPCPKPGTGGCWGGGGDPPIYFYCLPANAVGAGEGSFLWHSDNETNVDIAFYSPIPNTAGTLYYSANNTTAGGYSFDPGEIVHGSPLCTWPLVYEFFGHTNVTVEGTLVYNYTTTEPLL